MSIGKMTVALGLVSTVMWGNAFAADPLIVAEVQKPDHPVVQSLQHMAAFVAERSKGSLALSVKANGELGNESRVLQKLRAGELALGRISMNELVKDVPAALLVTLPYLFRSRDHLHHVLDGEFGKRLRRETAATGVVLLACFDSGTRNFYTNKKPLRTRADFEGMKIRVQPSPVFEDLIRELGGEPVVMPYDEVPDALRAGTIHGAENNLPSFVSAGHYRHAKYLSIDEHSMVPGVLLISQRVWERLSPQNQDLLTEAAREASAHMDSLWQEKEMEALAVARKAGVVVVTKSQISLTGIEGAAVKLYSKYLKKDQDLQALIDILRVQ